MRRVTGYLNGKTQWSENVPAHAVRSHYSMGGPIEEMPSEADRAKAQAARHREGMRRLRAERAA